MHGISWLLMSIAALPVLAQQADPPGTLQSGIASSEANGYRFFYTTVVEPPPANIADVRIHGGITVSRIAIHREMVDDVHHQSFGYDVAVAPGPGAGQFTLTISPLTLPSTGTTRILLPKYPPPTVVKEGDTIALDLLVSPDGKQKVVDYLQVKAPAKPGPATSAEEPRDYTPDDGLPHLNGDAMLIFVNGQMYGGTKGVTIKPGATLWVTDPHMGRYVLSLVPHEGFQKIGTIRDNVISFGAGHAQFEIRTVESILGKGAWNLYGLHQPELHPKYNGISIGIDRLENLLPKK